MNYYIIAPAILPVLYAAFRAHFFLWLRAGDKPVKWDWKKMRAETEMEWEK